MFDAKQKRRFFYKKDSIIIAALISAAVIVFFVNFILSNVSDGSQSVVEAEIYFNTKIVKTIVLRPGLNEKIAVPGQPNVILVVKDGKICFYSSTCKDKVCVKSGFLSRPGESAACLPNKVAVKIVAVGNNNSGPDTYAN